MKKLITLREWADARYSVFYPDSTLASWARKNRISPKPEKIGRQWMVHPNAIYIEKTIEAQRTENAKKELNKLNVQDEVKLSANVLRILGKWHHESSVTN